jgi:hypothetical protein
MIPASICVICGKTEFWEYKRNVVNLSTYLAIKLSSMQAGKRIGYRHSAGKAPQQFIAVKLRSYHYAMGLVISPKGDLCEWHCKAPCLPL